MRTILRSSMASLLAASTILLGANALASSHREAPAIGDDPAADNTDLYAWVQGGNLVILANYIPLEEPAGGPNFHHFADDVLYEIHIARGPSSLADALTYQVKFTTTYPNYADPANPLPTPAGGQEFFSQISGIVRTYSVTKIEGGVATELITGAPVAPPNIGPRTNALAYATAGASYEAHFIGGAGNVVRSLGGGQGNVFAGPRDDGFYVDLGGIFDLAGLRVLPSVPDGPGGALGVDNVAGYNTHTIALEIPLTVANGNVAVVSGTPDSNQTVGVWASASRRKVSVLRTAKGPDSYGPWVQVSRLGLPLINEAVIGIQDKDYWNRLTPSEDLEYFGAYFLNPVIVRDAVFAGFYDVANPDGVLAAVCPPVDELDSGRTDIIDVINLTNIPSANAHAITTVGDVLRVDLGIPSGFPNGRPLNPGTNQEQADVTDVLLDLLLCKLQFGAATPFAGIPDGANSNDKAFRADFPYLASPWEGFSEGHSRVTTP